MLTNEQKIDIRRWEIMERYVVKLLNFVKEKYPNDYDGSGKYHFTCPIHQQLADIIEKE